MNYQLRIGNFTHNLLNIRGLLGVVRSVVKLEDLDFVGVCVFLNDGRKHIISDNVSTKNLVTRCGVEDALALVFILVFSLVNNGSSYETPESDQSSVSVLVPSVPDRVEWTVTFVFEFCHDDSSLRINAFYW